MANTTSGGGRASKPKKKMTSSGPKKAAASAKVKKIVKSAKASTSNYVSPKTAANRSAQYKALKSAVQKRTAAKKRKSTY